MQELLKPIKSESLKEIFISRFENLILSGKLKKYLYHDLKT